jgi:hypothetical protein
MLTQPPPIDIGEVAQLSSAGLEAMRARDLAENGGRLVAVFSDHHGDHRYALVRPRGELLALRACYGEPLSEAEQQELSIIRMVRSIASAEHSKRSLETNMTAQQDLAAQMPLLAGVIESGLTMTRDAIKEQEEIVRQESEALGWALRHGS